MPETRQLRDLVSVGPVIERDLHILGVRTVKQLALKNPDELYKKLGKLTGQRQDPCVLDVFSAAVAQARDPFLPHRKSQWWYWSQKRKAANTEAK